MRFVLAAFALLLLAAPAFAQADSAAPSFGSITCFPHVPCRDGDGALSEREYIANADACVAQHFGSPSGGGSFFDQIGLDTNNCLMTSPSLAQENNVLPHCCLMELPDQSCAFHCELRR